MVGILGAMASWTCQRQSNGAKCGHLNPPRSRKCVACQKPRPPRKRPAHMVALDYDYAYYVELNGGDHCALCGRGPSETRKLDRDHDHGLGVPRGLLCHHDNRALKSWMTPEWLRAAADYLERVRPRV